MRNRRVLDTVIDFIFFVVSKCFAKKLSCDLLFQCYLPVSASISAVLNDVVVVFFLWSV